MATKLDELNQLIDRVNQLVKQSRGIGAIKNDPKIDPGGTGAGLSWGCHRFGGKLNNPVPESMRQDKYQGNNHIDTKISKNAPMKAESINSVIGLINSAIDVVKHETTGWGNGDVAVDKVAAVEKNTVIKLQQLQAAINAVNTIDNTLARVNGWFNSNNKCNRSCQVACQIGCQVACNAVNWCHDQKCGLH